MERNKKGEGRFRKISFTLRLTESEKHMLDWLSKNKKITRSEVLVRALKNLYDETVNRGFR